MPGIFIHIIHPIMLLVCPMNPLFTLLFPVPQEAAFYGLQQLESLALWLLLGWEIGATVEL